MTDTQKELLLSIGIIEDDIQYCYFSTDGQLFTLLKDKDGKMIKTGEQVYKEDYLNPLVPQPTQEEKQAELINNLILDNLNMQAQLDALITSGLGGN